MGFVHYDAVLDTDLYHGKAAVRLVLSLIAQLIHDKENDPLRGWCNAGQAYLSHRAGVAEKTVSLAVAQMKTDGVIEVRTTYGSGRRKNSYRLNMEKIEARLRPEPTTRHNQTLTPDIIRPGNASNPDHKPDVIRPQTRRNPMVARSEHVLKQVPEQVNSRRHAVASAYASSPERTRNEPRTSKASAAPVSSGVSQDTRGAKDETDSARAAAEEQAQARRVKDEAEAAARRAEREDRELEEFRQRIEAERTEREEKERLKAEKKQKLDAYLLEQQRLKWKEKGIPYE